MKTALMEFAPLEIDRAKELEELINGAARERKGLIIDPDEGGVSGTTETTLLSPNSKTNALVRYQRHY